MNVMSVANSLWIWLSLSIKELILGRDPMGAVNERSPTKSQTSQNIRKHTGEKPHKCNECGKALCMKSTLIIHQWTHTGEKSFKCSECEKSFYVKLLLNIHQRNHTGKKSHVCKVCGKAFSMKSSQKRNTSNVINVRSQPSAPENTHRRNLKNVKNVVKLSFRSHTTLNISEHTQEETLSM